MNSPRGFRWLMFGILGVLYVFVCLHRISPTVIARDLVLEFDAGATALGLMASAYFYLYAIAQPCTGYLMDAVGRSGAVYPLKAYYHNVSFFLICAVIAVIMVVPLSIQKNLVK